jgi:DNA-binding cell septation regulator SpoVG
MMQIDVWKSERRGKRVGTFDLILASGMTIKGCSLIAGDKGDFIGLPQREWKTPQGETKYFPIIEFSGKETREKFTIQVLQALTDGGYR